MTCFLAHILTMANVDLTPLTPVHLVPSTPKIDITPNFPTVPRTITNNINLTPIVSSQESPRNVPYKTNLMKTTNRPSEKMIIKKYFDLFDDEEY